MSFTHPRLELLGGYSPEYARHSCKVCGDFHLVTLCRIHYADVDSQQQDRSSVGWSDPDYFHGTSHCGCVKIIRAVPYNIDTGPFSIPVGDRCNSNVCATRSILTQGLRLKYVRYIGNVLYPFVFILLGSPCSILLPLLFYCFPSGPMLICCLHSIETKTMSFPSHILSMMPCALPSISSVQ